MSFGLFAFLFGLVTSYFRQNKLFLCTSYLLYSVLCTAYLFVYTPMQLYCVQLLIAVAAAMQSPVRNALYNKTITNGKETIGWGLYNLTFTFSIGLGAMIGSHLAHYFGFNWVFIGMSVMGMTAFFLTLIFA
ncbi:MFS transporter [Legionella nagasakiensis]|uniref:MFS transporter n=1 Tax=Legionella nagasakiensis TaxID=535290 RepID=UPI0010556F29|nr:MFS transporter [Legionella nagasakiensis]